MTRPAVALTAKGQNGSCYCLTCRSVPDANSLQSSQRRFADEFRTKHGHSASRSQQAQQAKLSALTLSVYFRSALSESTGGLAQKLGQNIGVRLFCTARGLQLGHSRFCCGGLCLGRRAVAAWRVRRTTFRTYSPFSAAFIARLTAEVVVHSALSFADRWW